MSLKSISKRNLFIALLFITFLVHISFLGNGFTWLDHNDIEGKVAILPLSQIGKAFLTPFGKTSFYRPIVTIFNSIDFALYNKMAPGYHLTNVILHILVVVTILSFVDVFFKLNFLQKTLASLIVGLHPASILIVGSITQRQEPLTLIGIMLTVFFHSKTRAKGLIKYAILTLISFALALFSKETALVIIPLLIIFWEIVYQKPKKKIKLLWVGEIMVTFSYLLLRWKAVPEIWRTPPLQLALSEAIGTRLALITKWVLTLINPLKPNFSDVVPIVSIFHPLSLITISIFAISFFVVLKYTIRSKFSILVGIFAIMLAPGLSIIPVPRVGSPHYAYLPTIPFAIGLVLALSKLKGAYQEIGWILLSIWIITAGISTFKSGYQFENDLTLFAPEVETDPDFKEGHYYLGNYYLSREDYDKAEKEFNKAVADSPGKIYYSEKPFYLVSLGGVKFSQNKLNEAEDIYIKAQDSAPDNLKPYISFNRALIANKEENFQKVVDLLYPTLDYWSQPEPLILLAASFHQIGKFSEEKEVLKKAQPFLSEDQQKQIEDMIKSDF